MKKMLLIICFLAGTMISSLFAQASGSEPKEWVEGIVFLDSNGNQQLDPGEMGLEGVLVSNGRDVEITGKEGRWRLSTRDVNAVFVIKPQGYSFPISTNGTPHHFYLLETATPANPHPIVHFALMHDPAESPNFSALFLADPQARGIREVNFISRDVVEELIDYDAAFGVVLGDIVADDPALFQEVGQSFGQTGFPWYYAFGNHDSDRSAQVNDDRDFTFRKHFGPSTYAFEYGEVSFIVLNNVFFNPDGRYRGHLTQRQLEFVKNYMAHLPENRLLALAMHIPVVATDNQADLYALINHHPHIFSISGHVHRQMQLFLEEEPEWNSPIPHHHLVNATVSGSWWCGLVDERGIPHATMNDGAPNGYSIISFNGNNYSVRFKPAGRPDSYQMNIHLNDDILQSAADTTQVLVNVFAGSARSKVEMRVGRDAPWQELSQEFVPDPLNLWMHSLSPYLKEQVLDVKLDTRFGWAMDYPSISTHIWKGILPSGLKPGTYTLSVRTTDMYNQSWEAHRVFRIR